MKNFDYKMMAIMTVFAVASLGAVAYVLSFVIVSSIQMSLAAVLAPMAVLGLASIILLINEMK